MPWVSVGAVLQLVNVIIMLCGTVQLMKIVALRKSKIIISQNKPYTISNYILNDVLDVYGNHDYHVPFYGT